MKPPEKPQMAPYFIDRHNYVKTFFHLLDQRSIIQFIGDTYSRYGTGKTTVLSTLYYQIDAAYPDLKPLWLSLDQVSVHYQNPQLAESNTPFTDILIRVQNVIDYRTVLIELAKESLPHLVNFPGMLETSSFNVIREFFGVERDVNASAADAWKLIVQDVQEGRRERKTLEAAIDAEVSRLTKEFLGYYNPSLRGGEHAILFADDYCWISDQPIGDWVLNDLTGHMDSTWVIISRTTDQLNVRQKNRLVENLYLSNFTPEEVASYLHRRLGVEQFPPMMVENVYRFSKGHAQTVSLVADLLQTSLAAQPDLLSNLPRWQEGEYEQTIPELLLQLIEDTPTSWLCESLWLGIIARRFDADLLYRVLMSSDDHLPALTAGLLHEEDLEDQPVSLTDSDAAAEDPDENEEDEDEEHPLAAEIKERILQAVTRYSFVEQHHDEYGIYYAFHNNMRDVVNTYLKENRAEQYALLHQKLADAYAEIMAGYDEQDPSERYVALYRYEDPTWQRTVSEWLYHVSQIHNRQDADLEFLNVYFLAFQWWEYYLPFPFCEHILKHWGWTQAAEAGSPIFELVSRFHEIYPRGFQKDVKDDPRWDEVRTLLEQIADVFDLRLTDPADMTAKQRALRAAILEMYTNSLRFARQPDYEAAESQYREVIQTAVEDGDQYNQSYMTAYLSDMLLEMGRCEEAYAEAETVNTLMDAEGPFDVEKDYEVLTLSYRVMGDACLFQGRYDEVAPLYIRASMCGYAQNYVLMHPPDPYTVKWYEDTMRLIARYLIQTAQEHAVFAEIEAICHAIHAVWDSFWRKNGCTCDESQVALALQGGEIDRLRAYLSPPVPDLNLPDAFSAEVLQDEHNRIAALFGISEKLLD